MVVRETRRNLYLMTAVVVLAAVGGWVFAPVTSDPDAKKALQAASLTLAFGALLGGFVKLILDDVDRDRQERAERAQFLLTILSDLKAVYDNTERARLLIPAHQSALTYGKELRGLIDAKVRLLNVARALRAVDASPSSVTILEGVQGMTSYLDRLIIQYRERYKHISESQRTYEARVKAFLAKRDADPLAVDDEPINEAWTEICDLPGMRDFLGLGKVAGQGATYFDAFVRPLDSASQSVMADLDALLGRKRPLSRIIGPVDPQVVEGVVV